MSTVKKPGNGRHLLSEPEFDDTTPGSPRNYATIYRRTPIRSLEMGGGTTQVEVGVLHELADYLEQNEAGEGPITDSFEFKYGPFCVQVNLGDAASLTP